MKIQIMAMDAKTKQKQINALCAFALRIETVKQDKSVMGAIRYFDDKCETALKIFDLLKTCPEILTDGDLRKMRMSCNWILPCVKSSPDASNIIATSLKRVEEIQEQRGKK